MAGPHPIVYPDADHQLSGLLTGERLGRLEALGPVAYHDGLPEGIDEYLARLGEAAGILLGWDLPNEVMCRAPNLKVVSYLGTGAANFIDLAEAERLGITVCNTPGYGDNAVAEHALALLLAVARRLPRLDHTLRQSGWDQLDPGFELHGKTLGLVSFGGIGTRFAEIARGLGMEVRAWTRNPDPERAARHNIAFVSLEDLLANSDVVSLHLLLTPETEGLLGAAALDRMKPGAVLINTARAELVEESALLERLRSGRLAGAGLDVFWTEPLPGGHPLLDLDNVVLSPHVGFNTPEAIAGMMDIAIWNLEAFFAGEAINVVAGPGPLD